MFYQRSFQYSLQSRDATQSTTSLNQNQNPKKSKDQKSKKKAEDEYRMDRNFKLRQGFCDYLDNKLVESTKTPPTPIIYPMITTMTEEQKKRMTVRKITEEEAEQFDAPEDFQPVLFQDDAFELRWYNKPDALGGRFQTNFEAEADAKLAHRLMTFFLKTEMLESACFKYDDIRAIRVFFMDDREIPNEKLMAILDNVLSVSMHKAGHFSDKQTVAVDYELRTFMSDQKKAKRVVLETMLKFPELIPDSWGGESAILKWKEMKEMDVRRREADAKDLQEEREKALEKEKEKEKKEKKEKEVKNEEAEKKKEEEKAKKEKERLEKEEKIKKEVEEAERKKKEEKENRRREVKKNREENADRTQKEKKEADEKAKKKKLEDEKAKKAKKAKKRDNKRTENTKSRDVSHEEGPLPPPTSPRPPPPQASTPPPATPPTTSPRPAPARTPPRRAFSMANMGQYLSGKKRKEVSASAEKVETPPGVDGKKSEAQQRKKAAPAVPAKK
uniref:SH2 domain-containing protein n=1 Tax=Caenorhabditis tropicalis TaxID=1561998 RepID=A0A1I7UWZ7_9PELO